MQATQSVRSQTFYLEHCSLTVCADDARLLKTIKTFASVHWLASVATVEPQSATTVAFHTRQVSPALPLNPASHLKLAQGTAYLADQKIYLVIDDATLVLETAPAAQMNVYQLHVYLSADTDAEAAGLLFTQALQAALRRADMFELHAAAAASPNGTGMLFIGDSGSGKSTLTVRLASQGWRYLTDDSLLLRQTEARLFVTPLRRVFALTPQTLNACGLDSRPSQLAEDKLAFEPAALFPAGHIAQFEPRHLVFPKLTQQPRSALTPLTQAKAMMRLLYHSPWACFDTLTSRAHLERLTRLAQTTRAWELNAGRDLLEVPDAAAQLLATLDAQ